MNVSYNYHSAGRVIYWTIKRDSEEHMKLTYGEVMTIERPQIIIFTEVGKSE